MAAKVRKGDKVVVTTGKDKGKTGEVIKILSETRRVLVSGVNLAVRHTKQSMKSQGGLVKKELPLHLSNVMLADPKDGKPTRVGFKTLKDGKKVRFAKKSGEVIDNK